MKILTIIGARPQFIKAAAVSRALKKISSLKEVVVHTGQHYDKNMSEIFFDQMHIDQPAYNLEINGLGHGAMTGRMIEGIEQIALKEQPDVLLVYGDTNSTLAGALVAKKLHIKLAHVEAGLRSFNMQMPEEINRIVTDRISDFLFCPTDQAIKNLDNEGFTSFDCQIDMVGDVMLDAALYYATFSSEKSSIISDLNLTDQPFALCTVHRAENTDDEARLSEIVLALNQVNKHTPIVLPIHPRTKAKLQEHNLKFDFKTIDPVGYFDMIELLKHCKIVLSDSGGLQKESFFFQKPVVVLRDQTEWVELLEHGFAGLAGANKEKIQTLFNELSAADLDYSVDLYGNGLASEKIAHKLQTITAL